MASNYPSSLDTFTNKATNDVIQADHINKLQDAVYAIESTLGTNPQGVYATVKARIEALSSSDGWIDSTSETWTYASATTFTISGDKTAKYFAGQKIKFTQTTVKYAFIVKVEYSNPTTTVTIYTGTDYTLANAAISANYYSIVKAPAGFPLDPLKWSVTTTDTSNRNQGSPTLDQWYNLGSITITIPVGVWNVKKKVLAEIASTAAGVSTTLSTANNTESDENFSNTSYADGLSSAIFETHFCESVIVATSATTYYLNTKHTIGTAGTIYNRNDLDKLLIRATIAYL